MDEDFGAYDLVPHKEVLELKKQVEEIKADPLGSTASGREMVDAMKRLSSSINELLDLFRTAVEEMKLEEKESDILVDRLDPMFEKMDTLIDQNQKIAKGIIAVADLIKEEKAMHEMPRISRPSFSQPEPLPEPEFMPRASPSLRPSLGVSMGPPPGPLPPLPEKKKGMFSFKK